LAGALTGARPLLSEGGAPGGVGAFGFVLDPAALAGAEAFAQTMRAWATLIIARLGAHGRIPGERAAELRAAAARDGVEIEDALLAAAGRAWRTAEAPFPAV